MTIFLRIILLAISVLNCAWMINLIRKSRVKIEDSIFWILLSGLLVCLSVFPQIIEWGVAVTGLQSSIDFLFLIIFLVLMVKLFQLSVRLSKIESKLQTFVQTYAIDKFNLMGKPVVKELKKGGGPPEGW